jgi:PEGA domain
MHALEKELEKLLPQIAFYLIAISALFLFSACSSSPSNPVLPASGMGEPATKTIQIVSDPPGARIEVDDDYVGDAPLEIKVPQKADGTFVRAMTIRATPTQQGAYVQSKYFTYGSQIPSRLLFSMGLVPVPQ